MNAATPLVRVPTYVPHNVMLYDKASHISLLKAEEAYSVRLPQALRKGDESGPLTDPELLKAVATAEAFMCNFSMVFGMKNQFGTFLHLCYTDAPAKTEVSVAYASEVFCTLSTLMHHPVYMMLRTLHAVVYERTRAYGALRDIRWAFRTSHRQMSIAGKTALFTDATVMLREFVHSAVELHQMESTRFAANDFHEYSFDPTTGRPRLDELSFATAIVLAINTLESSARNVRALF